MDTYHKKSIEDIKAMTDNDELRQAVADIEREIKSMENDIDDDLLYGPEKILINGNTIEMPTGERGEKLLLLLDLRREALNQMFRASSDEMALFIKVNNYLDKQTTAMVKRTAALYRTMMENGRDLDFDDTLEARGDLNLCRLTKMSLPIDDYYGSDFRYMIELKWLITYCDSDEPMLKCTVSANKENTPDKDDDDLVEIETKSIFAWERDSIFDCGEWADTFEDIDVCDAMRELCKGGGFSIPDLLHIEKVTTSSRVECCNLPDKSTTDLLFDFGQVIDKSDEQAMWHHLQAFGIFDDVYSVKLPVENAEVYLYATDSEAVLLMVEDYGKTELADEKPFGVDPPLYFSECDRRRSPVQFLCSIAKELKDIPALQNVQMKSFLLTNSSICNFEEMCDKAWFMLGVTVRHELKDIHHNLTTSANEDVISYFPDIREFVNKERVYEMDVVRTMNNDDSGDDDEDDESEEESIGESAQSYYREQPTDAKTWRNDNDPDPFSIDGNSDSHNDPPQAKILNYMKDSRQKLDELVGLDDIKKHVKDMVYLSQYNLKKSEIHPELKLHAVNLHSIFSGPIGVGKTTMAQLYSSLLHDAGVLSVGHVVICDRGTFIGKLWGDEERRVNQVIRVARGGVLFIDEAYTLASNHPSDPGRLILPMMLNLLADETQRDIAVVLAGYDKPMENLLSLNPGLASRFVNRFHFKPFTLNELLEIARLKNAPYGYKFTKDAKAAFKKMVAEAFSTKGSSFSNGRFIANLLEKTYIRHAARCMTKGIFDDNMLKITVADIPERYDIEDESGRMGFR